MKIRVLVLGALALGFVARPARAALPDLAGATIAQLQAGLSAGRFTSEQLVRAYLRRMAVIDRGANGIHAVLITNPRAIEIARALDAERRAKQLRGPLHGIPILIKDNIDTSDPMPTTAGSLALTQNFAVADSSVAARLRAAGAIILGKTNLSEWANFRSSHATSGWSAVGGLTRNPHARDRSACGSSSGSAAAVAAGLAPAAIGSETDGSITCPASMNGLAGLKPTVGQVPRTGIIPISHSQDTAGPIAHTAQDLALLMAVLSGADARDDATLDNAAVAPAAFGSVAAEALRGRRLGVLRFAAGTMPMVDAPYEAALERLRRAGAVLVEVALPDASKIEADEQIVLETELKTGLAAYLRGAPAAVTCRTLADLIAFNAHTSAETALFGQDLFEAAEATKGLEDPAYRTARADSQRLAGPEGIDAVLAAHGLDALIAPTTGPAWLIDLIYGDNSPGAFSTFPAVAGYPHLTVPMGNVQGLPVGMSIIGGKWSDARVLALGMAVESAR